MRTILQALSVIAWYPWFVMADLASNLRSEDRRVDQETLDAMMKEIDEDEGLQALSEEVQQRYKKPNFQLIKGGASQGQLV
mmetsp:Transcript_144543/g.204485  ORF Transcript_144543/g.204485 Transcript_144543/m.204485 type:complete len:81 (+) Transcript_144543:99-341(+)